VRGQCSSSLYNLLHNTRLQLTNGFIHWYNLCLWMTLTVLNLITIRGYLSPSSFQLVLPLIFVLSPVLKMRCYSLPYSSVLNNLYQYGSRLLDHVSRLSFPVDPAVLSSSQSIPKAHEKHFQDHLLADTLGPRSSSRRN